MRVPEIEVRVAVEYLRARARAEAQQQECTPDSLMLSKAADLLVRLAEALASARERNVVLQRQVSEYECREMGA
jgi:chromosomal replication initiation ATPase DnaA